MGSCAILGNELSEETHVLEKKRLYWEGCPGGEEQCKGNQEDCSATWLAVLGSVVLGLVYRVSPANHSNSGSFLMVHTLPSQDGFQ